MNTLSIIIACGICAFTIGLVVASFLIPENNFYQPEILEEDEHIGI